MNNLNYIKRIDDLGRIVIPKEIRRMLKIEENENMSITVQNDSIIIKKHSLLKEKEKSITLIGKTISELLNKKIIITNREKVIFSTDNRFLDKEISDEIKEYIFNRSIISGKKEIEIIKNIKILSTFISDNIIIDSDASGIIILYANKIDSVDSIILKVVKEILNNI